MLKIIFPGLIDPHVHLRDPGQTEKEDFYTGTLAALAGGFTTVLDMPNNSTPVTTTDRLDEKMRIAKKKVVCDIGFYFGSLGDNLEEFQKAAKKAKGLKLYLNQTTGNYLLDKKHLGKIFKAWPDRLPILVHAEVEAFDDVLEVLKKTPRKLHLCHMSTTYELKKVIQAKEEGLPITCGVTPHHLFLTEKDLKTLQGFGMMKPPLQSKKDVAFLWKHLKAIDCIESDHAPHTREQKLGVARVEGLLSTRRSLRQSLTRSSIDGKEPATGPRNPSNVAYGVPGLETTLPLLLTAFHQGKLTLQDVERLCHDGPRKIFNIKSDARTTVEVDISTSFEIKNKNLFTKCKWTPFDGWKVQGKVVKVTIRGKKVFENGKLLAKPGSGKVI